MSLLCVYARRSSTWRLSLRRRFALDLCAVRANSQPEPSRPLRSRVCWASGRQDERPQGRMVGPQHLKGVRAGLLNVLKGSLQQMANASVRGVCARCLFLSSSGIDLHPHCHSVVRRDCTIFVKNGGKTTTITITITTITTITAITPVSNKHNKHGKHTNQHQSATISNNHNNQKQSPSISNANTDRTNTQNFYAHKVCR